MYLKLKLIVITGIVLLFSGCAPTYSIEPAHGENSTVNIDTLTMNGLSVGPHIIRNYPHATENYIGYTSLTYSEKNQCRDIDFTNIKPKKGEFFTDSLDDMLRKKYKNCNVIEISNLNFYSSCSGKKNKSPIHSSSFLIGMSTSNSGGYNSISYLSALTQGCYNVILNHFKEKAIKDKVEIQEYKFIN